MLAVPAVEAVKVEVHAAVPAVPPAARVQDENVPVTPVTLRVIVPVGVLTGVVESVTVTVHVEPWLIATEVGVQDTVVVVG